MSALSQYSPDGKWWWNGQAWVPAPSVPPVRSLTFGTAPRRSWLAIFGGVTAIVAEAVILVSYVTPFATYDATSTSAAYTQSVFNNGYAGGLVNAIASVIVILLGTAAAIVILASKNRTSLAVACGLLTAFGTQELADWTGTAGTYAGLSYVHISAGVGIAIVGSLMLLAGGLISGLSLVVRPAAA